MIHVERGFTLVEVLVAFVVTALLLTIVMQGQWQATSRARITADRADALVLGRSLLEARKVEPFTDGVQDGREHGLQWSLRETSAMADTRGLLLLSDMHVQVSDARDRILFSATARRIKAVPR